MKLRGELFKAPARSIQPPSRAERGEYCWTKANARGRELEPHCWWSGAARVEEMAAWGTSVCEEQHRDLLALMPRKFGVGA